MGYSNDFENKKMNQPKREELENEINNLKKQLSSKEKLEAEAKKLVRMISKSKTREATFNLKIEIEKEKKQLKALKADLRKKEKLNEERLGYIDANKLIKSIIQKEPESLLSNQFENAKYYLGESLKIEQAKNKVKQKEQKIKDKEKSYSKLPQSELTFTDFSFTPINDLKNRLEQINNDLKRLTKVEERIVKLLETTKGIKDIPINHPRNRMNKFELRTLSH